MEKLLSSAASHETLPDSFFVLSADQLPPSISPSSTSPAPGTWSAAPSSRQARISASFR
jgi:hypothetical protein